ncbi:MAG: divergent polysaccharide deacetylase family protein [Desulfovibrionaceae bacterium]
MDQHKTNPDNGNDTSRPEAPNQGASGGIPPVRPNGSEQEDATQRSLLSALLRPAPLVVLTLFLVLLITLRFVFLPSSPEESRTEDATPKVGCPETVRQTATDAGSENYLTGAMESRARNVDMVLLDALRNTGANPAALEFLEVAPLTHKDEAYFRQTLRIPLNGKSETFLKEFKRLLASVQPEASLLSVGHEEWSVSLDGTVTHRLLLRPSPVLPHKPSVPGPKIVIVIDDMGEDMQFARGLADLPIPIVFAVWPNSSHASQAAALAKKHGLDLLVHLPMEPLGYPKDNPGKQALFVSMDDKEIIRIVSANLDKVPGAVGVNNHMGSRFTGDARGMHAALSELKRRGRFFLDSRTTPHSAAKAQASLLGLPYYGRDIFLDNVADVQAILLQLRKAEHVAKRNGVAIAIGHPHKATLEALRLWAASLDTATVVPLTSLPPQ